MLRTILVLALAGAGLRYAFRGAVYGLLFYLWVAYFRPEQWVWESPIITTLKLSYVASACVLIAAVVSPTKWRFNLRVALLLLFLIQALVSTMVGVSPDYAWPFWIEFLKTVVIAYLIVVLVTETSHLRMVMMVIALSLGLESAKQGWVEMMIHPGSPNFNPLPMLGDNNGVAVGMLMLVPILTVLAATARTWNERMFHRFLAFGVLYRGIVTYSRGGFLAAGMLALVYVLRSRRRGPALAGVLMAIMLVLPLLPDTFWARMSTIKAPTRADVETTGVAENSDEASAISRLHFWSVAADMAADRPIFGVGYNSYNKAYDQYDDLKGAFGHGRSVHSAWFGLMSELGYPGLLLFLAQLALGFRACWRARAASRLGPEFAELGQFAFAIEAGLAVFVVGATFLPFQYTEMVWHMLALSIALDSLARKALASAAERRGAPSAFAAPPELMAEAS